MGKRTPTPPDYTGAAEKQSDASQAIAAQQTYANRPNQVTPWGSVTYDQSAGIDPSTGKPITNWTQNTTLSPQMQAALDAQMAMQQGRSDFAQGMMGNLESEMKGSQDFWNSLPDMPGAPQVPQYGGLPGMGNVPGTTATAQGGGSSGGLMSGFGRTGLQQQGGVSLDGLPDIANASKYYDEAGQAVYDRAVGRLNPLWDQGQQDLEASLGNKGIRTGDQLYNKQQESFTRGRNDAYGNASLDATIAAGSEAARMFGMDLGARQQMMGERFGNAGLNNAAQSAQYAQGMGRAGFNNQTVGQRFGMDTQLRNEGRMDEDRRFGQQMDASRYRDQQRQQLMGEQLAQGGQSFGQGMQSANFQQQQRQQAIVEQMQQQGWSLNMINALMSGQQVGMPQMPGFMGASAGEAPQYLGAANMQYGADIDNYNARQQMWQGLMGGAGSMMMGMGPQGMGWFGG